MENKNKPAYPVTHPSVDTNIEEKNDALMDEILSRHNPIEEDNNCYYWHGDVKEAIKEYVLKSTLPVQEKPDFQKMIEDLVANDMLKLANNIWKNYVEKQPKV